MIRSQSEWLLINMTITNKTVDNFELKQSMLVYTVSFYGYRHTEMDSEVFPFHLYVSRQYKYFL